MNFIKLQTLLTISVLKYYFNYYTVEEISNTESKNVTNYSINILNSRTGMPATNMYFTVLDQNLNFNVAKL